MKLLGQIVLVTLAITVLQGLVVVLAIAILLWLIVGFYSQPERTMGIIAVGVVLSGLQFHPWVTVGAIGLLIGALLIARGKAERREVKAATVLLPPPEQGS